MISTFIMESINEDIVPFMDAGTSSIVAGAIGLIINKSIVQQIFVMRDRSFTKNSARNFINLINEKLDTETMLLTKRTELETLRETISSLIVKREKKILTFEEFKTQFDKLKEINI